VVDVDRTALVVVDVQNGFVNDMSRSVVPVIADLVERWSAAGRPVVFTRYLNEPGSLFEHLFQWTKLTHSPETDIVPELAAAAEKATVIDKKGYTLFNEQGRTLVEQAGWTELVFCGIDTEICVLKSAVDAFEAGITPWILSDASASHSGVGGHDAGILIGRRFIGTGQIITVADLIERTGLSASSEPR
jgi:nicotinamidase-related amidase